MSVFQPLGCFKSLCQPSGGLSFLTSPVQLPCASMAKPLQTSSASCPAGSEKRTRGAEEVDPGSPSKRLKIARQMSLGTVLRHVESQGQARGSLDSHVGAKPITVEDMTGEGPEKKSRIPVLVALVEPVLLSSSILASHCQMLLSCCCFMTQMD